MSNTDNKKKSAKSRFKKLLPGNGNKYTVPRRAATYVLRKVIVWMIAVVFVIFAFLTAMHAANIYIIVTEGVAMRASCILGEGDPNEMSEYFTDAFINKDHKLLESEFQQYAITSYDYYLDVESINVWAWNTTASMTVTERIPVIVGTANADAPSAAVPKWESARYSVVCVKVNGRWYINDMVVLEVNPPEIIRATPDMSLLSPQPSIKPTATVVPSATLDPTQTP